MEALALVPIRVADERLTAVARAITATHVNGEVGLGQFALQDMTGDFVGAFRREPGRLNEFFANPVVTETLRTPPPLDAPAGLGFERRDEAAATEEIARPLQQGGAYENYKGSTEDALRLARKFVRAAGGDDPGGALIFSTFAAWSPWFFDVAWDGTWLWLNRTTGVFTVFLKTDTD